MGQTDGFRPRLLILKTGPQKGIDLFLELETVSVSSWLVFVKLSLSSNTCFHQKRGDPSVIQKREIPSASFLLCNVDIEEELRLQKERESDLITICFTVAITWSVEKFLGYYSCQHNLQHHNLAWCLKLNWGWNGLSTGEAGRWLIAIRFPFMFVAQQIYRRGHILAPP